MRVMMDRIPNSNAAAVTHAGVAASIADGLSPAIDQAAARAPQSHGFLRRAWYAAACDQHGGRARTLTVVDEKGAVLLALPLVMMGAALLDVWAVPGSFWPFRSFPLAIEAGERALAAMLDLLRRSARAVRIGPIYEDDSSVAPLRRAARERGWTILERHAGTSFLLDIAALQAQGPWPRGSTLKKNRFHEKHLALRGDLAWRFVRGSDWTSAIFDDLAAIERKSWVSTRTDGSDAKFTDTGHGGFWREVVRDPVLAEAMSAAILYVDGAPVAFSFDLDAGRTRYAIANSYDPGFAKQSPGKLLYYRNLQRGAAEGRTLVDWGAGDSGYKRVIGADAGPAIMDYLFVPPGAGAWLARLGAGLWRSRGG